MPPVCATDVTSDTAYLPRDQPQPPVTPAPLSRSALAPADLASLVGLAGLCLLVICLASPSWLVSWQDTQSPFVGMGPWQICFNKFRFPRLQFDVLFHGCHPMWGSTYHQIREWLMPPWLLAIQGLLIICLILAVLARFLSLSVVFHYPEAAWLQFGSSLLLIIGLLDLLVGVLLSVISLVFAASCWSRSWLLYPNYNYLSWGWAAALLASWAQLASSGLFLTEARAERARKADNEELLFQLEPGHVFSTHNSGII